MISPAKFPLNMLLKARITHLLSEQALRGTRSSWFYCSELILWRITCTHQCLSWLRQGRCHRRQ